MQSQLFLFSLLVVSSFAATITMRTGAGPGSGSGTYGITGRLLPPLVGEKLVTPFNDVNAPWPPPGSELTQMTTVPLNGNYLSGYNTNYPGNLGGTGAYQTSTYLGNPGNGGGVVGGGLLGQQVLGQQPLYPQGGYQGGIGPVGQGPYTQGYVQGYPQGYSQSYQQGYTQGYPQGQGVATYPNLGQYGQYGGGGAGSVYGYGASSPQGYMQGVPLQSPYI